MYFFSQGKTCFHNRGTLFSLLGPCFRYRDFPVRKLHRETPVFITVTGFAVYSDWSNGRVCLLGTRSNEQKQAQCAASPTFLDPPWFISAQRKRERETSDREQGETLYLSALDFWHFLAWNIEFETWKIYHIVASTNMSRLVTPHVTNRNEFN